MPENPATLFTPVPNDHAIKMLRAIFGPIIDALLGVVAGGAGGEAVITSVIATFNLAVLVFAVVVGSYLLYSTLFDTAKDGEALGRETDTRYTFFRAGLGAVLLLPVAGGFTVAQVMVLQSLVWASAVGDAMWSRAATHLTQVSASYLVAAPGGDDFVTAGKLAGAMRARMLGHLCALHANEISQVTTRRDDVTSQKRQVQMSNSPTAGDTAMQWYFAAGVGYNRTSSMCGSVSMYYTSAGAQALNGSILGGVQGYAEALDALARDAARTAGEAAFDRLDAAALAIAQTVFRGGQDTEALKSQVARAIADATGTFQATVGRQVAGRTQVSQLSQSLLDASTADGWVFAAVWQRALSSFAFKAADAKDRVAFYPDDAMDPKAAGTVGSRYFSGLGFGNATERTLFEGVDRQFAYIGVLDATFAEAADPVRASGTMLERLTASNSDASVVAPVQWLYRTLFSWLSVGNGVGGVWTDPLVAIQQQGKGFVVAGTTLTTIGATAPTLGAVGGAMIGGVGVLGGSKFGNAVSRIASPLGWLFLGLGFVATAWLPMMPFAYYLSGVIAWLVTAVEAMAASSMWCLLALTPARGGDLVGTNRQGMMLLLATFLRPPLVVLGLIACYVVMSVGVGLLRVTFSGIFVIMAPDWSASNILIAAGLLVVYVVLLYSIVMNCCSFITGIGDAVMEWINVRASALGRNTIADDTAHHLNPQGRAMQNLLDAPSRIERAQQSKDREPNKRLTRMAVARFERP